MHHRLSWILGALLVIGLSACGPAGASNDQTAAQQFLTERNDGTPVALHDASGDPTTIGTIERVDGRKLTLKRPIDNTTETIELAADARISKQTSASRETIAVGQRVQALGQRSGETLDAQMLQIGTGALSGPMMRVAPGNVPAGAGASGQPVPIQPGSSGPPAPAGDTVVGAAGTAMQFEPVGGTVERIDGDTLTLTQDDGTSATVRLSATTQIMQQSEVGLDALTPGLLVLATGTRNGAVLSAAQIELLPAPQP